MTSVLSLSLSLSLILFEFPLSFGCVFVFRNFHFHNIRVSYQIPFSSLIFLPSLSYSFSLLFPILSPFSFLFFHHPFFRCPFFPCHFVLSYNSYGLWVKSNASERRGVRARFDHVIIHFHQFFRPRVLPPSLLSCCSLIHHWFSDFDHQSAGSNSY